MTDKNRNFYATKFDDMADIVEAMNTIVKGMNDETAYFENWIDLVPDEASREDFEEIAKDKE
ncbi:MAG: hypothetical protein LUD27_00965 [Clostridia bacterium]|nr:hypothetical protein [Clostridia bacterium]